MNGASTPIQGDFARKAVCQQVSVMEAQNEESHSPLVSMTKKITFSTFTIKSALKSTKDMENFDLDNVCSKSFIKIKKKRETRYVTLAEKVIKNARKKKRFEKLMHDVESNPGPINFPEFQRRIIRTDITEPFVSDFSPQCGYTIVDPTLEQDETSDSTWRDLVTDVYTPYATFVPRHVHTRLQDVMNVQTGLTPHFWFDGNDDAAQRFKDSILYVARRVRENDVEGHDDQARALSWDFLELFFSEASFEDKYLWFVSHRSTVVQFDLSIVNMLLAVGPMLYPKGDHEYNYKVCGAIEYLLETGPYPVRSPRAVRHEAYQEETLFDIGVDESVKDFLREYMSQFGDAGDSIIDRIKDLIKNIPDINVNHNLNLPNLFSMDKVTEALKCVGVKLDSLKEWTKTPLGLFLVNFILVAGGVHVLLKYLGLTIPQAYMIIGVMTVFLPAPSKMLDMAVSFTWKQLTDAYFTIFSPAQEGWTEQALGDSKDAALKVILTITFGALAGSLYGIDASKTDVLTEFMKASTYFKRVKEGTDVTLEFIFEMLGGVMNFAGEYFNIETLKGCGVRFPEILEISQSIRDLAIAIRSGEQRFDYHATTKLLGFEHSIRDLMISMGHNKMNEPYKRECLLLLEEVRRMLAKSKSIGSNGGPRPEPCSVAIVGQAGIGKSVISDYLIYESVPYALDAVRLEGYAKNKSNEVFVKHPDENGYWEGYTNQYAVKMDDALQFKDSPGKPNPLVLAHILMHNPSTFLPNFAFDNKGLGVFTSSFIFATDNNLKIGSGIIKSINCTDAFARRWDLVYLVAPKQEFCTEETRDLPYIQRKLKPGEITKTDEDGNINEARIKSLHEYYPWDWGKGEALPGGPYDYQYVLTKIKNRCKLKRACGQKLLDCLNDATARAIDARRRELIEEDRVMVEEVFEDPYKVLDLDRGCTLEDTVRAYRTKMRHAHPDKGGSTEFALKVAAAFEMLGDPVRRYEVNCMLADGMTSEVAQEMCYEVLNMKRKQPKIKIADEERIKTFMELNAHFCSRTNDTYRRNTMPSNEFMESMAGRMNVDVSKVEEFFYFSNIEPDTPMGDLITAWYKWWDSKLKSISSAVSSVCTGVINTITNVITNKSLVASIAVGLGVLSMAWMAYKKNFSEEHGSARIVRNHKPPVKRIAKARTFVRPSSVPSANEYHDESFVMTKSFDDMIDKVEKNIYFWTETETGPVGGYITFTRGKCARSVSHMMSRLSESGSPSVWLHSLDGLFVQEIKMSDIELVYCDSSLNEDDGYYIFKSFKREAAIITHHFMNENTLEEDLFSTNHYGVLAYPEVGEVNGILKLKKWKFLPAYANPIKTRYGLGDWQASWAIKYNLNTKPGFCGALWIVTDERSTRPYIAGQHAAGTGENGLAIGLSCGSSVDFYNEVIKNTVFSEECIPTGCVPPQWEFIKEVPFERVSSNSKLRKTPLHNAWGIQDKAPALLHKKIDYMVTIDESGEEIEEKIEIDPHYLAKLPCGINKVELNQAFLDRIADDYAKEISEKTPPNDPWEPRVFDFKQACEGVEGILKGIPRNTSAGYPWSKLSKKKFAFFGKDGDYKFDESDESAWTVLLEQVKVDLELCRKGEKPEWIYQQFLKDELRSFSKVLAGLSRLVSGSPLAKTMVGCVLFKDFMRFIIKGKIVNGIALGVNPCGSDWSILAEWLLAVGNCMIDGDFKNYDGSTRLQISMAANRVCKSYYYNSTSEDNLARDTYVRDTWEPRSLVTIGNKSYIIQCKNTTPSGDLLTGTFGSIDNILASRYAQGDILLRAAGHVNGAFDYNDSVDFDFSELQKSRFTCLGDDHVLSVVEEHRALINQKTYGEAMGRMGYVYTDAQKTGHLIDGHRKLQDIQFLKRTWRKLEGFGSYWFAPLELEVILYMPYWIEKGSPPDTLSSIMDTVGRELSAHGFDVWFDKGLTIQTITTSKTGIRSIYLPMSNDREASRSVWRRAVNAYKSTDMEYFL